jgi:MYXO-CTERM domain-containing protein
VVPETNEDNNVYVARMGAPLNLTATRLDAETPQAGVPGWLTVSVENTGGVPVRQAVAVVRVDGASLGRISLDATPGEVAQARLPWTPTSSGQASVSLMVDPEDALDEARRDDNALDTLVHVATAAPRSDLTVAVDEAAAARCEAVGVHLTLVPADAAEVTLTHALGEVARVRLDDDGRATWWPSDEDRARGDGWTAQTLTAQSVEFTLPPLDARCGERSTPEENAPWVTLGVTPRLALPGEPVQLEASGAGGARLELGVDGVVLGTLDAPRREDLRRVLDASAVTGRFQAFARLVDADGQLLAERTLGFERASSGPAARLEVGVAPDRADRATPVPVRVTLSAPWPTAPLWVERVHVAAVDLGEGRVAAEADAEARLNVDAPQTLDVPLDLTREAAARLTLVATAFDALGVQLGLGAGQLTLVGGPDAALFDAGGDPALDLDAAVDVDAADVDAQALVDGATVDAEPLDVATIDAAPLDSQAIDAALIDVALVDSQTIDAAPIDVALVDSQPIDASPIDRDAEEQTLDAALPDPRLRRGPTDGCGCAATSPQAASLWVALGVAVGAVLRRRRRVSAGRRA